MSTATADRGGSQGPGRNPAGQTTRPATGELSHRQVMLILTGLMAGMFLAALDLNIVATAIRTISDDLHGLSLQAWATTAYLITSTITTPLYGKLSDIYGRRPFFLTAISLFVVGSALCASATSMYELAAYRAIQGLGAGGLFSLALAIIGDIVPPRERARYQGFFLAVFGTASVLGPVIGGFLAGQSQLLGITGWRWVFLINVPIGIVALIVVARTLHIPHTRRNHKIDFAGAAALIVALVPLLIVAEQGRTWGWTSEKAWACYVIGAFGIVWFLIAEFRCGDEALIPMRLFRGRTFSIGSALNFIIGMGMFGGIAALPLYLQIVKGKSPTEAGLLLLPLTIGIMAGSIISGQTISRTGRYKVFPIVGAFLLLTGMLLMSRLEVDTSIVTIQLYSIVFGLGLGFNMQPLVLAVQNAVPPQDMGVATSSATFFRQMGGTLGTAVFLSVLFSTVADRIRSAFVDAAATPAFQQALRDPAVLSNPANKPVLGALRSGGQAAGAGSPMNDSSFINHLDPRLARPFLVGFSSAIDTVFLCAAAVLVVALVVVFFLPEERLRDHSGIQARMAEEAAEAAAAATPGPALVDATDPDGAVEPALEPALEPAMSGVDGRVDGRVDARSGTAAAGTHPIVEEARLLERVMQAADPTAPPDTMAGNGALYSSATELRQALDELRRSLDVGELPARSRRRRGPWLLLGLLIVTLVAGLAIGQGVLDRFDIALPGVRSSTPTASPAGPALPSAAPSPGGSSASTLEAQPVLPPAALPRTGPGISMPGTDVTVTFGEDPATDAIDVYEQAVFPAPGLDALPLSQSSLSSLGDLAALKPQVSDIRVELDGQAARAVPADNGTWVAVPPQGGRFTRVQLRYSVTGAVAGSTPSPPERALVAVAPLTGSETLRDGLPLSVRFTSAAVQAVTCPTAPLADSLCATHSGRTWTALLPSSATSAVVLAQVNLSPPT